MTDNFRIALRRTLAFGVDWLVILAWGSVLFGIVMAASAGEPTAPSNPWVSQAIGFFTMTLPVVLYFAVMESSRLQATLGKRLLGLQVRSRRGEPLSFGNALARNALKFTPWEFGHLVTNQAVFSGDSGMPFWIYGAMVVAFALPAWWVLSMFIVGVTPYDRLMATEVNLKY